MRRRDRHDDDPELFELLANLEEIAEATRIPALLCRLLEIYGLKSVAYLGSGLSAQPGQGPYLAVTYSDDWVDHYKAQRFVDVDPAVQIGMRRMLPIDWDTFDRRDKNVRRLFGEAAEFGLGRRGISLPVHGQHGDRALVSITSDASDRDWRHLRLYYMRDFQMLALHMHQAILRLEGQRMETASLSPRERECLSWVAEGKTAWETAIILGLSEHTVRCYLESARHKLGAANNTHAVNKAGKANLLSQIP
ncbi:LuxR family transcriptional regulator (plasmid) [Nitratireductor rhodophyticola]|jgi:DNA-binding CsgD family transcriptional regulator|uniref:LuxR family transcriptional regulator n=1 Tax=Nitratireductor rhodophyticola TaxID=2854036 RepID=A0ABS7RD88_9HYPH|nr:LuxR family transcriptional regulator [Nitratireductor rhodophyticola]MBO6727972.1 LuxR family transcriptional regulator [Rhizobiaceae bacterium]MBY8918874.1 LuxR family transcriptional regulator [Nitratireductor rhodophyticola]MEC9244381.1 LuxR family transcriptional regulator [Pseudomonadota bacterium]MBY8923071.1 LuxR family transcriptional regulator [Nitratireductor rhodophyticola]WPZ16312.1 LuxR family transcriptional regulator [Nitratireductor rhodophyticola]